MKNDQIKGEQLLQLSFRFAAACLRHRWRTVLGAGAFFVGSVALIPLLQLHNTLGIGKSYLGIWLAHTGFGLPMAIYLLRNYMAGLPREVIESARVDGATDFQIFRRIVLPLSLMSSTNNSRAPFAARSRRRSSSRSAKPLMLTMGVLNSWEKLFTKSLRSSSVRAPEAKETADQTGGCR